MRVRSSDIMAVTAILTGAVAGYGLTSLYAHDRPDQPGQMDFFAVMDPPVRQAIPRVHMHRSGHDRVRIVEVRRDARDRAWEVRVRAQEARQTAREMRERSREMRERTRNVRERTRDVRERTRDVRERTRDGRNGVREHAREIRMEAPRLEALERSMDELEAGLSSAFDGDVTIDLNLGTARDGFGENFRRRPVKTRPGDGSGG